MDIVDFIRARLDEDEQVARAASGPKARFTRWDLSEWLGREEPSSIIGQGTPDQPLVLGHFTEPVDNIHAEHIARHDPARVLREVEAKRRILNACEEAIDEFEQYLTGGKTNTRWARLNTEHLLRLLALPYADHPDYRPEWAPEGTTP